MRKNALALTPYILYYIILYYIILYYIASPRIRWQCERIANAFLCSFLVKNEVKNSQNWDLRFKGAYFAYNRFLLLPL